ncbi:MAG: saccharopine dehydrogenase NADP-binding domain-containing protein [Bacteroidetes bacterium]|nr:saccharopine dehydrogenase NADP-binding domain-containing protein [Bacteroidota bacterium]
MKNILVIGAGRSSSSLIKYLLNNSTKENWKITVGDMSLDLVKQKIENHANARGISFDVNNAVQREEEIKLSDIVISMLPAAMHLSVAKDCVRLKKHLATASYVTKEMMELNEEAKKAGIILINEIGLDPGIDHASAMKVIDRIHEQGGELISFKSYCGGLVAPESNDNPWGYKFSWNPRNVVLAGQGTAQYIENGEYKYIPYSRLFTQIETIETEAYGKFEAYANRDSLSYRKAYNIEKIPTMLRGTLRMPGYCKAWNVFVKLGITDDTYKIEASNTLTYRQLIEAFLPPSNETLRADGTTRKPTTKEKLVAFLGQEMDTEILNKIEWLRLFDDKKITLENASPAQILQDLLEERWKLKEHDKDMIVMQHQFEYRGNAEGLKTKKIISSLIVKGEDQTYTAMAKTVGLPLAITAKLILQNKISARGVIIPTLKEIYEPVLKELETFGIVFEEKEN